MAAREGMEAPYFRSLRSMTSARILVVWAVGRWSSSPGYDQDVAMIPGGHGVKGRLEDGGAGG